MTEIGWIGFAGAWLLVVGPLYQGARELLGLEVDREGMEAAVAAVAPPAKPSAWWWLVPPVMLVLQQRRSGTYRRQAVERLTAQQRAQYAGFRQKAAGWFVVATGAFLLAVKETWELAEHLEWSHSIFAAVIALMIVLALIPPSIATSRASAEAI
jgi:hypothetical protein